VDVPQDTAQAGPWDAAVNVAGRFGRRMWAKGLPWLLEAFLNGLSD
jgi:hypothetical protein